MLQRIKEYVTEKKIVKHTKRVLAWALFILNFPLVFIIASMTVIVMQGVELGVRMYHASERAMGGK